MFIMPKVFICFILLLCCFVVTHSQITKLYFFKQDINGGASKVNDIAGGADLPVTSQNQRFFLFAELKKENNISFEQVWVNGKNYFFKIDSIKQLPFVLRTSPGGEMIFIDTLIKTTNGLIVRLNNLAVNEKKIIPADMKNAISLNAVVVCYKLKKRKMNFKTTKTQMLRPLFVQ